MSKKFTFDPNHILSILTENLPFWVMDFLLRRHKDEHKRKFAGTIKGDWLNLIQQVLFMLKYDMTYVLYPYNDDFYKLIDKEFAKTTDLQQFSLYNNFKLPWPEMPKVITQQYWGPYLWHIMHCISIVIQDTPYTERFARLVYLLNNIMLCGDCIHHFESMDRVAIYKDVVTNPVMALYHLHSEVNAFKGTTFTLEDFKTKYGLTERP